jgi:hypothetical protein
MTNRKCGLKKQCFKQLWAFAHEMWKHRNSVLHDTQLEFSRRMRDAKINNAIVKLYDKVESYSAEDSFGN